MVRGFFVFDLKRLNATNEYVAPNHHCRSCIVRQWLLTAGLFLILTFASACQQDTHIEQASKVPAAIEAKVAVFDATCSIENGNSPESQLGTKLVKLSDSKYDYKVIEQGSVDIYQSVFFRLQFLSESDWFKQDIEIIGFENLLSQIAKSEFNSIKGSVDLGGRVYPRATVEEYIFKTEDCAKLAEAFLTWADEFGPWGTGLYKTPTRLIRDKQRIYHVIGNGTYMMDRIVEIESALKP